MERALTAKTFSSMLRTTESLSIGAEIESLIYDKDFNLLKKKDENRN